MPTTMLMQIITNTPTWAFALFAARAARLLRLALIRQDRALLPDPSTYSARKESA